MPPNRNAALVALAASALSGAVATPAAASTQAALGPALSRQMQGAGSYASAYVTNLSEGRKVFSWKAASPRILASNTKLFTTSAALARYGTEGTLGTEVLGRGRLDEEGIWRGDLYLRGGGDPTFGSRRYTRRMYKRGASVEALAKALTAAGIERVTGRVIGDESRFDSLRGGPDSGYGTSIWVGPLSALSFNRGLANESGSAFQSNPPAFAAARLDDALEARGVRVRRGPGSGRAPRGLDVLASVESPPMERLVKLTLKPSDNFFAETLLKDLALQASGRGTTAGGARIAARYARRLGARARIVDGSGLSRGNRASPRAIVKLLGAIMRTEGYGVFVDSLPIAGRDGTLYDRMRRGPARGHCHAKTGTLSDVSALSGYCEARSGDTYAFSILMNAFSPTVARRIQDKMVQAMAGVTG
jgi:D-alanyl-D-alanine carboxypeptidase/D-alanyl-D-alanine-endopeptidase (penicillin-binding protein 4)